MTRAGLNQALADLNPVLHVFLEKFKMRKAALHPSERSAAAEADKRWIRRVRCCPGTPIVRLMTAH